MAADILWSDIVGLKTLEDGGYVGDLMQIARAHVDDAVTANRLTQAQAGEIYTAMVPAAFKEAIAFSMGEQLVEAQIDLAVEKVDTEKIAQQAVKAKARDEQGMLIDEDGNFQPALEPDTQHYQTIDKMKADNEVADINVTTAGHQRDAAGKDVTLKAAQLDRDYGYNATNVQDTAAAIGTMPQSRWEAEMQKSMVDATIGDKTATGFEADAYYKVAKFAQEQTFALANSGVITGEDDNTYKVLAQAAERSLNKMATVWGGVGAFVNIDNDDDVPYTDASLPPEPTP